MLLSASVSVVCTIALLNMQKKMLTKKATLFAGMKTIDEGGNQTTISVDKARAIHEQLIRLNYLENGQLTKKYFDEKRGGNLDFGSVNAVKTFIVKQLELVYNPEQQKPGNSRNKKTAKLNTENFSLNVFRMLILANSICSLDIS